MDCLVLLWGFCMYMHGLVIILGALMTFAKSHTIGDKCKEGEIWCVDSCLPEVECSEYYKFLAITPIISGMTFMAIGFIAAVYIIVSHECKLQRQRNELGMFV